MNNRIKELEPQCWEHNEFGLNFNYQKFAELIIFECTKVAVFKDSGMVSSADVAGHVAAGRSIAARMIREHFGVEE